MPIGPQGLVVVPPDEVKSVLAMAQIPRRYARSQSLDPSPMARAVALTGSDGPYILTPHEVRVGYDASLESEPAGRAEAGSSTPVQSSHSQKLPGQMLTVHEFEAEVDADGRRAVAAAQRKALINNLAKLFAVLITIVGLVGGIIYWTMDSKPRPGSRVPPLHP